MSESVFIEDGQSREVVISGKPGLYPAIRARYRPALADERYSYGKLLRDGSGKDQFNYAVSLLKRHLENWDVKDRNDNPIPIAPELLKKLHPDILARLVDSVLSYSTDEETSDAKNS
jgi:hypothetical protein